MAQAKDRVEHRTGRAREDRAGVEGGRVRRRAPAAEKASTIGLVLARCPRAALPAAVTSTAATCMAQIGCSSADRGRRRQSKAPEAGYPFRLEEQLAERRVGQVVPVRSQDDLGSSW